MIFPADVNVVLLISALKSGHCSAVDPVYTGLFTALSTWLNGGNIANLSSSRRRRLHWRYPLTPLLYTLIFFHAIILMVGGMYAYARFRLVLRFRRCSGLSRNPYDKLGHFFQGLVPALAARDSLLRVLRGHKMTGFLVLCCFLSGSATYELIEWWAAQQWDGVRMIFLGTRRSRWITQSDMFCALLGAVTTSAAQTYQTPDCFVECLSGIVRS